MAQRSVDAEIHDAMARLTAAEKRAARALLANYPTLGLGPVADFAQEAGASAATVLRFVAQLGYASYPDLQRKLREELDERLKSPLQKTAAPPRKERAGDFLPAFIERLADNMRETAARIPASEFEAICVALADARAGCHIIGGRFTDAVAHYLASHLRIVRPGVRTLEPRGASRNDQLLDVKAGDCAVIFDIRRYDPQLLRTAKALQARRAMTILITDAWISPVSRHARHVLPCQIDLGRTWDSSGALFAMTEAIIARATEIAWDKAAPRIQAIEKLQED